MVGPPGLPSHVAVNAVSRSATPLSTLKPAFSKGVVSHSTALNSSKESSGFAWIFKAISLSSLSRSSTAVCIFCFSMEISLVII
jgi:hypothetical protein